MFGTLGGMIYRGYTITSLITYEINNLTKKKEKGIQVKIETRFFVVVCMSGTQMGGVNINISARRERIWRCIYPEIENPVIAPESI